MFIESQSDFADEFFFLLNYLLCWILELSDLRILVRRPLFHGSSIAALQRKHN